MLESVRWRICKAAFENGAKHFDVGLTAVPERYSDEVNISEVGGLKEGIWPMDRFQKYTAVLDMDGESWSSRFGGLLCLNSVILKVESHHHDFFIMSLNLGNIFFL